MLKAMMKKATVFVLAASMALFGASPAVASGYNRLPWRNDIGMNEVPTTSGVESYAPSVPPTTLVIPSRNHHWRDYFNYPVTTVVTPTSTTPASASNSTKSNTTSISAAITPPTTTATATQATTPSNSSTNASTTTVVTATAPATLVLATSITDDEQQMINLINQDRARNGLPALKVDIRLVSAAREKAADIKANNYFSNTSPNFGYTTSLFPQLGLNVSYWAENIGAHMSVEAAELTLEEDASHQKNILDPNVTHVGVGIAYGSSYGNVYVQEFAKE